MKQGEKLTPNVVIWAKAQMLAGTHPRALARQLGVGLNTIVRMRDGETYNGPEYRVEGEELLRPPLTFDPANPAPQGVMPKAVTSIPLRPVSEEEIRASEQRLLATQTTSADGVPDWLREVVDSASAQGRLGSTGPNGE